VAGGRSTDPYHPRAVRASSGAIFRITPAVERDVAHVLDRLEQLGFALVAATPDGATRYDRYDWRGPFALVLGSESVGITPTVRARVSSTVSVPMAGAFDSLSIGAAAAIVLFEAARQRGFGAGEPA
jgi:TrmH family RNA methyltransferase